MEGRAAFDNGIKIITCPYDATSPCGLSWLAGWVQQYERRKKESATETN
jgi:hypothetical protein